MSADSSCQSPNCAGVTYVVIPTTGLATLEEPLTLPPRHDRVEQPLLDTRVVQVMLHDLGAERVTCHRARLESHHGVAQRRRETIRIGLVRVALQRGPGLQ